MKLDSKNLLRVSQILDRDSMDTTYKFALLRATIDAISLYDHLIKQNNITGRVTIPTGIIVERWLWYYYPLLENEFYPQKHGEPEELTPGRNIVFRRPFNDLIGKWSEYEDGTFKQFYNFYKKKALPVEINHLLAKLVVVLYDTIVKMPMKHIGQYSSGDLYSIYQIENGRSRVNSDSIISSEFLIENMGTFSIPTEFYITLKYLGSIISGMDSIIYKWADFVALANRKVVLNRSEVLERLFITPENYRDVNEIKGFYDEVMKIRDLYCVWSDKKLNPVNINVDHVLPFSRYPSNSFWNLLPARNDVNSKKKDKIPSPDFIDKRQARILEYWDMLHGKYTQMFESEIQLDLISDKINYDADWQAKAIDSLKKKAEFLIDVRGLEPWDL